MRLIRTGHKCSTQHRTAVIMLAITDHVSSENQLIVWENMKIMDHESDRTSRAVTEATWIRKTNNMN